mmetsp:Transcript_21104/g.55862  ORF Transcript_21104/g.55862 Transcript_21104/m.55862 type:complete len:290 (-) Transcript_21104:245-1114(-)
MNSHQPGQIKDDVDQPTHQRAPDGRASRPRPHEEVREDPAEGVQDCRIQEGVTHDCLQQSLEAPEIAGTEHQRTLAHPVPEERQRGHVHEAVGQVFRRVYVPLDLAPHVAVEGVHGPKPVDHAGLDHLPVTVEAAPGLWVDVPDRAAKTVGLDHRESLQLLMLLREGFDLAAHGLDEDASRHGRARGRLEHLLHQTPRRHRVSPVNIGSHEHQRQVVQEVGAGEDDDAGEEAGHCETSVAGGQHLKRIGLAAFILQLQVGCELERAPEPGEVCRIPQNDHCLGLCQEVA